MTIFEIDGIGESEVIKIDSIDKYDSVKNLDEKIE